MCLASSLKNIALNSIHVSITEPYGMFCFFFLFRISLNCVAFVWYAALRCCFVSASRSSKFCFKLLIPFPGNLMSVISVQVFKTWWLAAFKTWLSQCAVVGHGLDAFSVSQLVQLIMFMGVHSVRLQTVLAWQKFDGKTFFFLKV